MDECPFCLIINKKLESVPIYEDEKVMAVLDVFPNVPGQVLVFPKRHVKYVWDLDDEELIRIFTLVRELSKALKHSLNAKGISIYIPQDEVAGQRVDHLLIYIFPRFENDKFVCNWQRNQVDINILKQIASRISNVIGSITKKAEKKVEIKEDVSKEDINKKIIWYLKKP